MIAKLIELRPEVAKAFVDDMKAFFAASGKGVKAAEIAARINLVAVHSDFDGLGGPSN